MQTHQRAMKDKYGNTSLTDLMSQKSQYWMRVDQCLPPPHKHRDEIALRHGIDWPTVDKRLIFKESKMAAFQWNGYHGKLYARQDLQRFDYIQEADCIYCTEKVQTVRHLFTACPVTSVLFKNFERQYKLVRPLSECEKLIGIDSGNDRSDVLLKRNGILRNEIYRQNHAGTVPRWEQILYATDR